MGKVTVACLGLRHPPGQWTISQSSVSVAFPTQGAPLCCGSVHSRARVRVREPHVLVQGDQSPHGPKKPSTEQNRHGLLRNKGRFDNKNIDFARPYECLRTTSFQNEYKYTRSNCNRQRLSHPAFLHIHSILLIRNTQPGIYNLLWWSGDTYRILEAEACPQRMNCQICNHLPNKKQVLRWSAVSNLV